MGSLEAWTVRHDAKFALEEWHRIILVTSIIITVVVSPVICRSSASFTRGWQSPMQYEVDLRKATRFH